MSPAASVATPAIHLDPARLLGGLPDAQQKLAAGTKPGLKPAR